MRKPNKKILIITIIVFLIYETASQVPLTSSLIDSRRVKLPSHTTTQSYTISIQSVSGINSIGVILALSSFSKGNRIGVKLKTQTTTSITVEASPYVSCFSYLVVFVNETCSSGQIRAIFGPPGVVGDSLSLVSSLVRIRQHNQVLQQFGRVEPFISEISCMSTALVSESSAQVGWIWETNSLKITRSIDITLVKISYLIYLKLGSNYITILPLNGVIAFNYDNSYQPIFVATNQLRLIRNPQSTFYFVWTATVRADVLNVQFNPLFVVLNTTRCNGTLSAISNPPDMMICQNTCPQRVAIINSFRVCIRNNSTYQPNATLNVSSVSQLVPMNLAGKCGRYRTEGSYLFCQQCNHNNNYVEMGDGSCFCKPGYYSLNSSYLTNPWCYPCEDDKCPFVLESSLQVGVNQENSTEYLTVSLTFNQQYSRAGPYKFNTYQQLKLDMRLNNAQPSNQLNWTSPNRLLIQIRDFPYSQTYKLSITMKNQIVMDNNSTYIYLSPSIVLELNYSHPEPAKLVASSMQAISNAAPTAALVSLLLGSRINLFSFLQVSSTLYLSSYVSWPQFGSINRVSLSRSLFKFTPSNFLATFQLHLAIPIMRSDDNGTRNLMLKHNQNQMYISIAPEYWLSTIIQVVVIELVVRILSLVFGPQQTLDSKVDSEGKISWVKKSFLTQFIESSQADIKSKLSTLVGKIEQKRFIFYTTMLCSQLVFHSFMIFSQFKINVTNADELVNVIFTILVLTVLVGLFCISPRSPMVLFKCVGIIYKKKQYEIGFLLLYYVLGVLELVLFGASVALFQHSMWQCAAVISILAVKIVLLLPYIKVIQLIKNSLLFGFFITLGCGSYFPKQIKLKMETALIGLMMGICLIELVKILRSIIVLTLGFLREPPSMKGKSIINSLASGRGDVLV